MEQMSKVLQVMLVVFVIVMVLAGQSYAETPKNHSALIQQRKQMLQRVINRINELIAERERLTGQLIILQQLDNQAAIDTKAAAEAEAQKEAAVKKLEEAEAEIEAVKEANIVAEKMTEETEVKEQ